MYVPKSGAQKRKAKKKRSDNESRGLQTLFQVGVNKKRDDVATYSDTSLEVKENVDGCHVQDSLHEKKIEAIKETDSEQRTNTIDISSEPGPDGTELKYMYTKYQSDNVTGIPNTSSKPVQEIQDKFEKISTGPVGLDIGFLTAEVPSQSDIENYVIQGHIDFPSTFPKDSIAIRHFLKVY